MSIVHLQRINIRGFGPEPQQPIQSCSLSGSWSWVGIESWSRSWSGCAEGSWSTSF